MTDLHGFEHLTNEAYYELSKLTSEQKLEIIEDLMMEYGNDTQNFINTWTNRDCSDPSQDDDPNYVVSYFDKPEYEDMESDEYYEAKRLYDEGITNTPIHLGL